MYLIVTDKLILAGIFLYIHVCPRSRALEMDVQL